MLAEWPFAMRLPCVWHRVSGMQPRQAWLQICWWGARLCGESKAWGLCPYLFVFFPSRKTSISITLRATVNI